MRLSLITRKTLSELFKGLKVTRPSVKTDEILRDKQTSTSSTSSSSWELGLQRLAKTFDAPEPLTKTEEGNLVKVLQGYLQGELKKQSSDFPVHQHFEGLFNGLENLSAVRVRPGVSISDLNINSKGRNSIAVSTTAKTLQIIGQSVDNDQLIKYFDELYYHGRLTRQTASAILKNPHIKDLDHIFQVLSGGGLLLRLSVEDKLSLRLQIANKYWKLDLREKSRQLLVDCFESTWIPALDKGYLSIESVERLAMGLLAFNRENLIMDYVEQQMDKIESDARTSKNPSSLTNIFFQFWKASIAFSNYEMASRITSKATTFFPHNSNQGLFFSVISIVDSIGIPQLEPAKFKNLFSTLNLDSSSPKLKRPLLSKLCDLIESINNLGYHSEAVQASNVILKHIQNDIDSEPLKPQFFSTALIVQRLNEVCFSDSRSKREVSSKLIPVVI